MLQTFCTALVMIVAIAETSALIQWSREIDRALPATVGVNIVPDAAHFPIAARS
jgi:hypothetical protein